MAEQTQTLSGAYKDAAERCVALADGPFRSTPTEHLFGAMAVSYQAWGGLFAKCGL